MKTDKYIFVEVFSGQEGDGGCFPNPLEPGKVYFCKEYSHSVHICPCGCGDEVHIPFKEQYEKANFWGMNGTTFTPSILKTNGCKSHYYIKGGNVEWAN